VSEANYPEVQLQKNFGKFEWLAQTFTPLITHEMQYVSLKLEPFFYVDYVEIAIQYTLAGIPTGIDLATDRIHWVTLEKWPQNKVILFRFRPLIRLVATIEYALILRVPTAIGGRKVKATYEAPPGHYPRGKLIKSSNAGSTWDTTDLGDLFFSEWGDPPVPPSPVAPPLINFAILDYSHFFYDLGVIIRIPTNVPCHLTCYWTDKVPLKHRRSRTIRGVALPWGTYFCFVAWHAVEQLEYGASLYHTFLFPDWQECQTRWFTFRGTVDLVDSPSVGPIFMHHNSGPGPPQTEEQTSYNQTQGIGYSATLGLGQRISVLYRTLTKLGFWLSRRGTGGPGTVSFKIIRYSDKIELASKDLGLASSLPLVPTYKELTLDAPISLNDDIIIVVWNEGGDTDNCAVVSYQYSDIKPSEHLIQYAAGWLDLTEYDCAYIYTFYQ